MYCWYKISDLIAGNYLVKRGRRSLRFTKHYFGRQAGYVSTCTKELSVATPVRTFSDIFRGIISTDICCFAHAASESCTFCIR
jgi:hypothetical protein